MSFGLQEQDIAYIAKAAGEFPEIEAVILFGSRAKGNFKKASDIDLAIKGKSITTITVQRISARLNEELPLPYFVDVLHYESITNPDLIGHINRVGVVIYPVKP
ncbi:MAG: nucleotidyltransferase domain-containing protein [Desulfobacteraceae bacterium]|nr:nucleotidyltransferase domain-containing protein [Desulfobacteraceae bacterium]